MPSTSPKQKRFMAAVAHGWKPDKVKAPPVAVAKEFNKADEAKAHAGRKAVAAALHKRRSGRE